MRGDPEQNKRSAIEFYDLTFNRSKPREAMERFGGPYYRQHNPFGADGKVVEHWDVLQVVPEHSASDNTMF